MTIAFTALKEKIRRKELYIVSAIGAFILLVFGTGSSSITINGEAVTDYKILAPILLIVVNAISCVLAVIMSLGTIPNEYERNTSHLVWIRKIPQYRYHGELALANIFTGLISEAILFVPMFIAGIIMLVKSPQLLQSRLDAKEKRGEQSAVVKLSGLMFIVGFVLAGLNFRFGWIVLPDWVSWAASAVFLISYALYAEVLRENVWLSRTIQVQENQQVVDTGLYGVVRHPMYAVTVILFLSIPLVLGSWISFFVFLAYPFIIAKRIRDEETLLENELSGYAEYKQKVKYRMIPYIW